MRRGDFTPALALLVCSACRVTIAVGVDSHANGSGVVRAGVGLDADAVRQVGDLGKQLRVDDLRRAGWTILGPRKEGDGRTWVRASKAFADAAGARTAVAELNGPSGPFKDFHLSRHHSFLRTKTSFSGTFDFSGVDVGNALTACPQAGQPTDKQPQPLQDLLPDKAAQLSNGGSDNNTELTGGGDGGSALSAPGTGRHNRPTAWACSHATCSRVAASASARSRLEKFRSGGASLCARIASAQPFVLM